VSASGIPINHVIVLCQENHSFDQYAAIVFDAMAGVDRKGVSNLMRGHAATLREIAFIDRNVDDLETLLAGLRPELDPILLSDDEPALCQIARLVRCRDGLDAIHVIAHGRVGEVSFGAGALSLESLAGHAADLRAIGQALGNDGKLLLWSCDTAAGARGSAFLEALESATGAEVRAAAGTIRSQSLGGGWQLDVSSGKETIAAPLTARGMAGYSKKGLAHRSHDG
jgi:large repetitive protein